VLAEGYLSQRCLFFVCINCHK